MSHTVGVVVGPPALPVRKVRDARLDGKEGCAGVIGEGGGEWVRVSELPGYLRTEIEVVIGKRRAGGSEGQGVLIWWIRDVKDMEGNGAGANAGDYADGRKVREGSGAEIRVLSRECIARLQCRDEQWVQLLLLREHVTNCMGRTGLSPGLIFDRARVYEALGCDELAVGDAYVGFTLAGGEAEDLVEATVDEEGEVWDVESVAARRVKRECLRVMVRGLTRLGCMSEVVTWEDLLRDALEEDEEEEKGKIEEELWRLFDDGSSSKGDVTGQPLEGVYGKCQRVIYPWNEHEPDRMSSEALSEINDTLRMASDGKLECRRTVLPSLVPSSTSHNASSTTTNATESTLRENAQLGLFASTSLLAGEAILHERSCLTAIRPHAASICDCCATDLESISPSTRLSCPGCSIPFCSQPCLDLATSTYHTPNPSDKTTDSGYPPSATPFCPGTSGDVAQSDLGRAESSSTPEWDLYFLLVQRCIQMSITLDMHPLDLFEVKYLWGAFTPHPSLTSPSALLPSTPPERTLPFSLNHHVILPFQLFEYILPTLPSLTTYTRPWLARFDFWAINTLYAKFRGVATASQSSFDGKAETAQVHPLWCLANHSCSPNVEWEPGGVRVLRVREKGGVGKDKEGIEEGGEIWNHYTDVTEKDVRERRRMLKEVLGGQCMCGRCVREDREMRERGRAWRRDR